MKAKTPAKTINRIRPRNGLKLNILKGANQADKAGADINTIVAQYKKHGTLPNVGKKNPLYGDFTFGEDLHEMREAMFNAEDRFHDLPSSVRAAADNDWVKFLDMFEDPVQQETLTQAGLIITDNPPPTPNTSSPTPDTPTLSKDEEPKTDD